MTLRNKHIQLVVLCYVSRSMNAVLVYGFDTLATSSSFSANISTNATGGTESFLHSSNSTTATCTVGLLSECQAWYDGTIKQNYNCSLPGLTELTPGMYEGVNANFLGFATEISSPNFPHRAKEFEACTGGRVVFADAQNIWEDPVHDLGTKRSRGRFLPVS